MASSDFPPLKNAEFNVSFPIFDSAGAPLVGATVSSSKISKDHAALAPTSNSVTAIGEGLYYITLTNTEMNADEIILKVESDGKPVVITMNTVVRQMKDLSFPSVSGTNQMVDIRDNLVVEGTLTFVQALRLAVAAAAGKLSGATTTTVTIRDTTDAKNRIIATVDANGNRSAVTLDVS